MTKITITSREGVERTVDGQDGHSLMEIIRNNGFDELVALCGGNCSCGTCHVYLDGAFADKVSVISQDENELLDSSNHRRGNSRLSCQIRFSDSLDGLRLTIAPED